MILQNISKSDEGKYTCFAENFMGKANSTGILSVRGRDLHLGSMEQEMAKMNDVIFPSAYNPKTRIIRESKRFQEQQQSFCLTQQTALEKSVPISQSFLFLWSSSCGGGMRSWEGRFGSQYRDIPAKGSRPFPADATKITLAPSSADINVGENLTLQCHASHDPTMDLTFTWSLDDFPIDFDRSEGHYRRASAVSAEGIPWHPKGWEINSTLVLCVFVLSKAAPSLCPERL